MHHAFCNDAGASTGLLLFRSGSGICNLPDEFEIFSRALSDAEIVGHTLVWHAQTSNQPPAMPRP